MDLRALGALLSALGGVFSAKAGATAGQLQGLLMGEDLTERRKRMRMSEETFELQKRLAEAEEARKAELFPLTKRGMEQQLQQSEELFPLKRDALATQVEMGRLQLDDARLWTLFRQGVSPSQITDPVLRQRYEPFFNFQMASKGLEMVQSDEDLNAILQQVPEEFRPTLEMMGRMQLFINRTKKETTEKHLKGLDLNLAQGEAQLRAFKLNHALSIILNNINNEGMDWDKRTPQRKIEAVKKWIASSGLQDDVPEDFANMFQRVKSIDARQYALYRAQSELQLQMQRSLMAQQFGYNRSLWELGWWGNIVAGAMGGGGQGGGFGGGTAPVGFSAPPSLANVFRSAPDNNGSYINQTALNNYLKPLPNFTVPFGNGMVPFSVVQTQVGSILNNLGRPNADITANDINTLATYDAGLHFASAQGSSFPLDWNTSLAIGVDNILAFLRGTHHYRSNPKFRQTVEEWARAWERNLQARQGATAPAPQSGGRPPASNMPTGVIGGQNRPPAQPSAQPRSGSPPYTSSARRKRE